MMPNFLNQEKKHYAPVDEATLMEEGDRETETTPRKIVGDLEVSTARKETSPLPTSCDVVGIQESWNQSMCIRMPNMSIVFTTSFAGTLLPPFLESGVEAFRLSSTRNESKVLPASCFPSATMFKKFSGMGCSDRWRNSTSARKKREKERENKKKSIGA